MQQKLPILESRWFKWTGRSGHATLAEVGLNGYAAKGFYIHSAKSNTLMLFLPDQETMEANDFYDGEAYAYFAPGGNVTVEIRSDN